MIRRVASTFSVLGVIAQMMACCMLLALAVQTQADDVRTYVPAQAAGLLPVLHQELAAQWPTAPQPWTLAGQIEQESCITLRHPKCWNPRAELKTSREYGFGLGQTTIAYNADGSVRFNNFDLLTKQYPALRDWTWADRYNADYQLRAFVLMSRDGFNRVAHAATLGDQWAFALAGYNGGAAGVLKERLLCQNTHGCDATRWWGNVEATSTKSRLVPPGYGGSPFSINRAYPRMVLVERRDKYEPLMGY